MVEQRKLVALQQKLPRILLVRDQLADHRIEPFENLRFALAERALVRYLKEIALIAGPLPADAAQDPQARHRVGGDRGDCGLGLALN